MPGGRPTDYCEAIADKICEAIVDGKSLRSICKADDMPSVTSVMRWLSKWPEFREQYARARELQADTLFDEMIDIADDGTNDWMERKSAEGENLGWQFNGEAARRSQIRIDARKWMAGKMQPKKYGDKIIADVTGKLTVSLLPTDDDL